MKYKIIALLLTFCGLTFSKEIGLYSVENLLDAIEKTESGSDCTATGDNGAAAGSFQLHKIYVDDVNRILGRREYTYQDRWNRDKSRDMTRIYITYYGKGDLEKMCRCHNGGPKGHKKKSTEKYWQKVKTILNVK